jgi:hypothetical protein
MLTLWVLVNIVTIGNDGRPLMFGDFFVLYKPIHDSSGLVFKRSFTKGYEKEARMIRFCYWF